MHELSIVNGIVEIAEKEASLNQAKSIDEIELTIGKLSTIEPVALDFAWKQGVKGTSLEHSRIKINWIDGEALCMDCDKQFIIAQVYDPCPSCGSHLLAIQKGKELAVSSLVIS